MEGIHLPLGAIINQPNLHPTTMDGEIPHHRQLMTAGTVFPTPVSMHVPLAKANIMASKVTTKDHPKVVERTTPYLKAKEDVTLMKALEEMCDENHGIAMVSLSLKVGLSLPNFVAICVVSHLVLLNLC